MKWRAGLWLVIVFVGVMVGAGTVRAAGNVAFGLRPAQPSADDPRTYAYFVHTPSPGETYVDEVVVINSGDEPITLEIFAADGITAINGGTAFADRDQDITGVGRWISLPVSQITLAPGTEQSVPFTVAVPTDTAPGQYVAGIVVSYEPEDTQARQLTVRVIQRSGIAVLMEVPGLATASLEITGVKGRIQDGVVIYQVSVHNSGGLLAADTRGSLEVRDAEGVLVTTIPLNLGTILARDRTVLSVVADVDVPLVSQQIVAAFNYGSNQAAGWRDQQFVLNAELSAADQLAEDQGGQPHRQTGVPRKVAATELGPESWRDGFWFHPTFLAAAAMLAMIGGVLLGRRVRLPTSLRHSKLKAIVERVPFNPWVYATFAVGSLVVVAATARIGG